MSHSIVSNTCKYLKMQALALGRSNFTVRSTDKKCCLEPIDAESSTKEHRLSAEKEDSTWRFHEFGLNKPTLHALPAAHLTRPDSSASLEDVGSSMK